MKAPVVYHKPDSLYTNIKDSMLLSEDVNDKKTISFFLLTTRQPVPLKYIERGGKITVWLNAAGGFCEGPATICCMFGNCAFFYPVQLVYRIQDQQVTIKKDYRSPKTVNPDSSLLQQRILFNLDNQRILLPLTGSTKGEATPFFYSDSILLAPRTATYLVDTASPVTSIYVQPGTNTRLTLAAKYLRPEEVFVVQTTPLNDRYKNTIADGTMVTFISTGGAMTYRREAAVFQGVATIKIPVTEASQITVRALINNTCSAPLTLNIDK